MSERAAGPTSRRSSSTPKLEQVPGDRVDRRERILDAATALFAERGFLATAIDDVGEAAGVTGPAVYRHFESKQHLLAAVVRRSVDTLAASEERVLERAASPAEALDGLVQTMIETAFDNGSVVLGYSRLLQDGTNLPTADREWLREVYRVHRERWTSLLLELRPELARDEAELNVEGVFWLVRSVVFLPSTMERWRRMRHVAAMAYRVLLGADPRS